MYPMLPCSHEIFASWLGWNAVETMGVVAAQTVVPRILYCNPLISILSPRGFQLPVFLICCNLVSFSLGVSTANLSRWLVLIRCNLASLSSGHSAASLSLICCNLVSLSSGVSAASLSLICCNLVSLSSRVSAASLSPL